MQTRRREQVRRKKASPPVTTNPRIKIMKYDFFAEEWFGNCGACQKDLYAPTKSEYMHNKWIHTHSDDCLGGY